MKFLQPGLMLLMAGSLGFVSCNDNASDKTETKSDSSSSAAKAPDIKEYAVSYKLNGTEMKSYVTYDANKEGKRPIVLVVPEWWGLTEYPRMRAKQLAEMGYLAMAVDMYGDGKVADNPGDAQKFAGPFYQNPQEGKARL